MKTIVLSMLYCFSLCFCCTAEESRIDEYLKLLNYNKESLGKHGNYKNGEIEIILVPELIKEIEEMQRKRCLLAGMSEKEAYDSSRVGIVLKDQHWLIIRDAVTFPTGAKGTYNRLVWISGLDNGIPGVVICPVLPNKKIAMVLNYRHATRDWSLELPRGGKHIGEKVEDTVSRELMEETGFSIAEQHFLGRVTPDSGTQCFSVPIYLANLSKRDVPNQDYSEAILRLEFFTIGEIKEALSKGWMEVNINGKRERVDVNDGFLAYAILMAEIKNLL